MSKTLLGFDFGTRRIGVAVGDAELKLAHPLETIDAEDNATRFARITALIMEWKPQALVVGLPLSLEDEAHDMTRRCQRFAHQLHGRFNLPIHFIDERWTSTDAATRLREAGGTQRQKYALDQLAAQRILQDHLDRDETDPT